MTFVDIGVFKLKFWDYSSEDAESSIFTPKITAANITAQEALNTAYQTAVTNLTIGSLVEVTTVANQSTDDAPNPATTSQAQVELNWMILYRDTVTLLPWQYRIPCPDMNAALRLANEDFADLTNSLWIAFKAAFEAAGRSPAGNPVQFRNAVLVGKDA